MDFQYLVTGVSPAHGDMAVQAVSVPVSIRGMDVAPGAIIHMDENGAITFPAKHLDAVLENVKKLEQREADLQDDLSDATSAAAVKLAFRGEEYGEDEAP